MIRPVAGISALLLLAGCSNSGDGPVDTTLPDEASSAVATEVASESAPAIEQGASSTDLAGQKPIRSRVPERVNPYEQGEETASEQRSYSSSNQVSTATPLGNPGNWVTSNDYPTRALREDRGGTSRFRLSIGPDGRVADCIITQSSGSADLDEATCANVTRRARFRPATDAAGTPVMGYYSSSVHWSIPGY